MKWPSWRRTRREADLDDEIQSHLDMSARDRVERGDRTAEAERAARREFGNVSLVKEVTREMWGWGPVERLAQDLRYGLRLLRRSPGFTAVAILSVALGIGANATIFGFLNAVVLRPLPYPGAGRIVVLFERVLQKEGTVAVHPYNFLEWQRRARSFEAVALVQPIPVNTMSRDGADQIPGLWVTADIFRVFGVAPLLGRGFTAEETSASGMGPQSAITGHPVVILSHEFWRRRFAAETDVTGRKILINGRTHDVIGVAPPGFRVASMTADVYLPMPIDSRNPDSVGSRSFLSYGRLRSGVTIAAARAELTVIADRLAHSSPLDEGYGVAIFGLHEYLVKDSRLILLLLMGVVGTVLLIACANLASLLLTRGIARQRELAIRASLGAGRGRLVRQLMIESLLLSSLGGAAGLALAVWTTRVLLTLSKGALAFGRMDDIHLDSTVVAFTIAISTITAVMFGLLPAWETARVDAHAVLKAAGGTGDRRHNRLRSALVIGEMALAVMLLIGAGLLLRTFSSLLHVRLGFEPEQALTMRLFLPDRDAVKRADLVEQILQRVETLPGVRAAGTVQFLPIGGFTSKTGFSFVDRPGSQPSVTEVSLVSRGYFSAMAIPVGHGRPFNRADHLTAPGVAIVNNAFVETYCPESDPVGRTIAIDWAKKMDRKEIVGIVGDIRHNGLTTDPQPTVFLPYAQTPGYIVHLVVRTAGDPAVLTASIRRQVQQVDPTQTITAVKTMEQYVSESIARPRLYAALVAAFAAVASLLAAIGLYGLVAYAASRRTREIGIRIALGAQRASVVRMVLQQGVRLALAGVALGLAGALALGRVVSALLFGVTATDPLTYAAVSLFLLIVAFAAAVIPARRAAHIDPTVALRWE